MRLLCAMALLLSACAKTDLDQHSEVAVRLIDQRGAPDFVDASTTEYSAIRHTPSGMICVLPDAGAFEFDVFPANAMNAGAQCSTTTEQSLSAWIAVRFREPTTLDVAFASAVAQLNGEAASRHSLGRARRATPIALHPKACRTIESIACAPTLAARTATCAFL
ncbi:MAG: hypothetical protein M0D54_11800 [Hyphomonadaceae bacterium JAD_PAG50586_4]|nr:MAG: hypothetical protein M0D54_11800 [Hyphomonadaceae bacterium JAD_PAG50586_4]